MWRVTFASLTKHARRLAATTLAVVLGVGFTAGTLIFGDTAQAGFDETFARTARNVDAVVLAGDKPLTADQLTAVSGVAGVEHAEGRMVTSLPMLGSTGRPLVNNGRSGYAVSVADDERLRGFDLDGRVPGAGEALLDTETAAHEKLSIGQTIQVLDKAGTKQVYAISGLVDFGVSKTYSGLSVVGLPRAEITRLTGETGFEEIVIRSRPGIAQTDLAGAVRAAVTGSTANGATVQTGDERRTDLANQATSVATQFTFILLVFGVISLVVAVFVIYNTFAILLAQRLRETALLRCVGATRRQIFTATLLESAAIGLVGGAFGVLAGIGVSYGLPLLLNGALDAGVPEHPVVLRPTPVLIGLTLGMVATVAAAVLPALRATRTKPLAALRDLPSAVTVSRRAKIIRGIIAFLIAGIGALVTRQGQQTEDSETATFIVVAGGVVVFLGVLVASPLFIGRLTALVGLPASRLAGPPGRVAVANARRNPGRTAVTTASLMIGVGLMAMFSMLLGSIKETARDQLASHYPVDYVITAVRDGKTGELGRIPAAYSDQLRQHGELAKVAVVRGAKVRVDGKTLHLGAIDHPELLPQLPAGLVDGAIIVDDKQPDPQLTTLRTAASGDTTIPGAGRFDGLVTWSELAKLAGSSDGSLVLVKAADGVSPVDSRAIVDRVGSAYPLVEVSSVADLSSGLEKAVNGLIGLFAGLLGTAVLIALFGIANTLSLSVIERTRESATLRALGLTRGQLRGMLLAEALLMGVVGALVGIAFGLVYAPLVLLAAFRDIDPVIVVPWDWLTGMLLLAALASCLAAVLPARRAGRGAIVAAMAD
ncbi:putative ABC transport system permease protein [Hamadaea flava]|uniref:ABC transporter permease n=1 Tax=Hamadaea flava TaxID=1742688 RepID=A0ABV8LSP9_9ACTN|nr:FtsX-like permease family protein [Hamadaea flava]MCP2327096.1 putative ABC transport system permease protein [Hamadaea flava]